MRQLIEQTGIRRVAIDLTNSPHVPFFAPLIRRLEDAGVTVDVFARHFAQTIELAELHNLNVTVIGQHGGGSRLGKARAAIGRTRALSAAMRKASQDDNGPIHVALSHGSTDMPMACRRLKIPHVTMFDYEWAKTMHRLNCRLSWRVMTPTAIAPSRLYQYGVAGKLVQYEGLKEEYYLSDAHLDPHGVRKQLGIPSMDTLVVLRPPPSLALYHRGHTGDAFGRVVDRCLDQANTSVVLLPRIDEQANAGRELAAQARKDARPGTLIVPEHAVDALSLIASSDQVVSAGGTMNREAVALGVPVATVFAGRMGGVDEALIADGRLTLVTDPNALSLRKRDSANFTAVLRDPKVLLDLALDGVPVLS